MGTKALLAVKTDEPLSDDDIKLLAYRLEHLLWGRKVSCVRSNNVEPFCFMSMSEPTVCCIYVDWLHYCNAEYRTNDMQCLIALAEFVDAAIDGTLYFWGDQDDVGSLAEMEKHRFDKERRTAWLRKEMLKIEMYEPKEYATPVGGPRRLPGDRPPDLVYPHVFNPTESKVMSDMFYRYVGE